jgi:hypothetical protein
MRTLLVTIVILLLIVALGITIRACVADARRRGKSPLLVTIAVIFFFPWGPIAWLLFRPEPLDRIGSRRAFRLDDHRLQ